MEEARHAEIAEIAGRPPRSVTDVVTVLDMYDMPMPIFMSMCGSGLLCWAPAHEVGVMDVGWKLSLSTDGPSCHVDERKTAMPRLFLDTEARDVQTASVCEPQSDAAQTYEG